MSKILNRSIKFRKNLDFNKFYNLNEVVKLIKKYASPNFDETIDIAINLYVDPRKANEMIRGVCNLPAGVGKNIRVAVFASGDKINEAKDAGADIVGSTDLIDIIKGGKIEFDCCIATPDMMPIVSKLGKILGPKGMMPNPRIGNITLNIKDAVKSAKSGLIEFRVDKSGIIHTSVGKVSFSEENIIINLKAIIHAVIKTKPNNIKGDYLKCISVSSSMGPGIKVNLSTII